MVLILLLLLIAIGLAAIFTLLRGAPSLFLFELIEETFKEEAKGGESEKRERL